MADDCPLKVFIKCLVNENYSYLVIDGTPPPEAIEEAGLNIYSEYCSLTGGVQISSLIQRSSSINALSSKVQRVGTLLAVAEQIQYEELCNELTAEGFKLSADVDDNTYQRQIVVANAKLKAECMRLDEMLSEKPKPGNKPEKATEKEFTMVLMEISKYEGYPVRDNITVLEYGLHVQRLRQHIEAMTPKKKAHGSK